MRQIPSKICCILHVRNSAGHAVPLFYYCLQELVLTKQNEVLSNLASLDEEEAARAQTASSRWQVSPIWNTTFLWDVLVAFTLCLAHHAMSLCNAYQLCKKTMALTILTLLLTNVIRVLSLAESLKL